MRMMALYIVLTLDFGMMIGLEGANSSTGMQLLSSTSLTGVLVGVI